jgi:hypothetical protein
VQSIDDLKGESNHLDLASAGRYSHLHSAINVAFKSWMLSVAERSLTGNSSQDDARKRK